MSHADYYSDLTLHLRNRGLDDNTIEAALQEVQELARESGQSPEEEFGPAAEYAKTFPDSRRRTAGTMACCSCWVQEPFCSSSPWSGAIVDRRLPKSFTLDQEAR